MRTALLLLGVVTITPSALRGLESADSSVPRPELTSSLLEISGVRAGLCVHLGTRDGMLSAEFARSGNFLVHALCAGPEAVETTRDNLQFQQLYGQVTVDESPFDELPYADNVVNLVVVDELPRLMKSGLSVSEILRVLAPGGVAVLGQAPGEEALPEEETLRKWLATSGVDNYTMNHTMVAHTGIWIRLEKPWPEEMDEWTHRGHDAGASCVSRDTAIGPLHGVRWIAGPAWPLGIDYQVSGGGMVSAGGRIFFQTTNTTANIFRDPREREQTVYLVARDAFNGLLLWSRELPGERMIRRGELENTIVARETSVFVLASRKLVAFDAATGERHRRFDDLPGGFHRLALAQSVLLLAGERGISAVNPRTGEPLWSRELICEDLLASETRVFVTDADRRNLIAFELGDGEEAWSADLAEYEGMDRRQLAFYRDGVVVFVWRDKKHLPHQNGLAVFAAPTGKLLWGWPYPAPAAHWPYSVHHLGGLIWLRLTPRNVLLGVDPRTGARERRMTFEGPLTGGCYRNVATEDFLIGTRPFNLIDLDDGSAHVFRGGRHTCRSGVIVANGLLYAQPHGCKCVPETLRGFVAFAAKTPALTRATATRPARLELGSAFGAPSPSVHSDEPDSWPTFRRDPARTAGTATEVPDELELLWSASVERQNAPRAQLAREWRGGIFGSDRLTAPVVDDGVVFVSAPNSHRVAALDARTGAPGWTFTTGGRIDTPPTIYDGLCLFGSHDGWVYCLRARDGQLMWRFLAAPRDRRIVTFGQLESLWPVVGGVLIDYDRAFFVAGRSGAVDGGLVAYAVEPSTGRVLWQSTIVDGGQSDLGVSDGQGIFVGRRIQLEPWSGERRSGGSQALWSGSNRLLDRSWQILSADDRAQFWMRLKQGFGSQPDTSMNRIHHGFRPREGNLVVASPDRKRTYAYRVRYIHWRVHRRKRNELGGSLLAWDGDRELWTLPIPEDFQVESLVLAGGKLLAAGPLDRFRRQPTGKLWVISAADGSKLAEHALPARPVSEGLAVVSGRLYVSLDDGTVRCYGKSVTSNQ